MTLSPMPPAELTDTAIRLLSREMGVVNTARFISQFTIGYSNYTVDRDELFKDLTIDDIASAIQHKRATRS
jgi:hypothetical protein